MSKNKIAKWIAYTSALMGGIFAVPLGQPGSAFGVGILCGGMGYALTWFFLTVINYAPSNKESHKTEAIGKGQTTAPTIELDSTEGFLLASDYAQANELNVKDIISAIQSEELEGNLIMENDT